MKTIEEQIDEIKRQALLIIEEGSDRENDVMAAQTILELAAWIKGYYKL